jgi:predicted DNA-binding WGR domain protein
MDPIYLERHEPAKNIHRFYQMHVVPGIFGDWSLIREWGRIGSPGTVRKEWFDTEGEALARESVIFTQKSKKGYQERERVYKPARITPIFPGY